MCKSTYFEHQLANHGGAFTSPDVEGVDITNNGMASYMYIYRTLFNRLIAEDFIWRPINVSQSAVDSNWRPAGSEWFRRF